MTEKPANSAQTSGLETSHDRQKKKAHLHSYRVRSERRIKVESIEAVTHVAEKNTVKKLSELCSLMVVACASGQALRAEDDVRLRERFAPGYHYHVGSRVDLSGSLTLPAEKGQAARSLPIRGRSAIEYDERIVSQDADDKVRKTVRVYSKMDFERKVGDQVQQNSLRPEVRRLVLLRHNHVEVPFAPEGPLTWGEIDLVRTDVFTPALAGLLPDRPVLPGATWQAALYAVQELTDLEKVEEGTLTCKFESLTTLARRRHARVTFSGTVRGLGEDGPAKHQLDGSFLFDLESNHLSYLSLKGIQSPLDKSGNALGHIEGTFVLTRQPYVPCRDLTDEALRGVVLEPNEDNTLLLYENSELGVRFLYPRRWRVAGGNGRQIGLDEPHGNGVLMTIEPLGRIPSGAQYLQESKNFLARQKAGIVNTDSPRQLQAPPYALEHFGIEADIARQRLHMEYYVIRQRQGGATLAARLLPADLSALQRDVRRIAQSVRITRQQ